MGQTLSNGVYLPNEGERNCYAGLASNWQILNTAVGNIAEKAPLVHTHGNISNDGKVGTTANQPLITGTGGVVQAGAFGNQANTFCEGNDSRLSDARTPVAHTHGNIANDGKLTNGNRAVITGSDKAITESSVTDTELGYLAGVTSAIQTQINAKAADTDVVHKSENETISGVKSFLNTNIRFNSSSYVSGTPSANIFYAPILIGGVVNNADKNTFQHNAAIRTTGINDYSIRVYSQTNDTLTGVVAETNADASNISFRPIADSTHNLGTSSYRWKSFNGINPGALSLPSENASSVNLDPTNWNVTGTTANRYTPPADGWLGVQVMSKDTADLTGQYLFVGRATGGSDYYPEGGTTSINVNSGQGSLMGQVLIPVISGKEYHIRIKIGVDLTHGSSITARFYTCLGNV